MGGRADGGSWNLSEENISGGGSGEPCQELLMAERAACLYIYPRREENCRSGGLGSERGRICPPALQAWLQESK